MKLNRQIKFGKLCLVLFFVTAILFGCSGTDNAQLSEAETAAIYAAVIEQIYNVDDTFGGTLQPPTLYILGTTDDSAGEPGEAEANAASITQPVREQVSGELAGLSSEIVWVQTRDDVPVEADTGAVVDGGALITPGNITPQPDGSVHVPASIYVASLAAGGQTYILEETGGAWTVTGNTGVQWIS